MFEGLFFQQYRTLLSKPRPPPRSSLCPPVSLNSLLQVAQAVGRCVLCRVVFVSLRYLGGALNKVQLHDLLILELSSFKKKKKKAFSKVSKVTRPSCNFSSRFPNSDSGIRADAAVENVIFLSSE